mmetsp:Transcript_6748/g.9166  ORF Transcript_6748/g.9166 Transcript_6748/m.9166 type:complete len:213 (+) Transcript_6748:383-1021(+)
MGLMSFSSESFQLCPLSYPSLLPSSPSPSSKSDPEPDSMPFREEAYRSLSDFRDIAGASTHVPSPSFSSTRPLTIGSGSGTLMESALACPRREAEDFSLREPRGCCLTFRGEAPAEESECLWSFNAATAVLMASTHVLFWLPDLHRNTNTLLGTTTSKMPSCSEVLLPRASHMSPTWIVPLITESFRLFAYASTSSVRKNHLLFQRCNNLRF